MAQTAFVGTYTHDAPDGGTPGQQSEGIHVYDTSTRPWRPLNAVASDNPSYLAIHPRLPMLYAVNEVSRFEGESRGSVQAFRILPDAPFLAPVTQCGLALGATGPAHLTVSADGGHLLVSAYGGGQFNTLALDEAGTPGPVHHIHLLSGRGPHADRQAAPHAHVVAQSPDLRTWVGCDLGSDRVLFWSLEQGHLVLEATLAARPGSGPRHAVFHPHAPRLYVINELDATIDCYARDDATDRPTWRRSQAFTALLDTRDTSAHASDRPAAVPSGQPSGAALVMHPSGRWLYASTRRLADNPRESDAVSAWEIDPATGALQLIGKYHQGIDFPREMRLSPTGDTLYVLNQKGGNILAFEIDTATGALGDPADVAAVPTPVSLVFHG